ncbi:MAG: GTPase Era [delta proteobacterium ML8_F1]|nr:MAG: GTPase Era [delta proteobacterium ML8_F1]
MSALRSGFVAIIGRSNVGKSTLLNQLVGEKVAITTDKPQTTRHRIQGMYNDAGHQIIFLDTPGIHKPRHRLGELMVKNATETFDDADVILVVIDAKGGFGLGDQGIFDALKSSRSKKFLILNKMDLMTPQEFLYLEKKLGDRIKDFDDVIAISAATGKNLDFLLERIKSELPEGPRYFPEEVLSDQPEKAIIAEIIREKVLMYLEEEIPHGVTVLIESFKPRGTEDLVDIGAVIVTEKSSHKGIIIGKGGRKLKGIGKAARVDIERFLGMKVYLEIWVKVKEGWRDSDFLLKNYGFKE